MYQIWSDWLTHFHAVPEASEFDPIRQQVLAAAQPQPGETVVDVGAGLGMLTFALADLVTTTGHVIAVEPSDDARAQLHQMAQERDTQGVVEVRAGKAEDLALDEQSCDLVITRSVLIYVDDKRQAFREFARVLQPNGRVVCWEPINAYSYRTGRLHTWFDLSALGDVAAVVAEVEAHYFTPDDPMCNFTENDLLYAAADAGFTNITLTTEHNISHYELTVDSLKNRIGWSSHLAPTYPTLQELLASKLTRSQIDALFGAIERQLREKKLRLEGARALLTAQK